MEADKTMLFSPQARSRRLQLRISERRLLIMLGDVAAITAAVFVALSIWALVDREQPGDVTLAFILARSGWFLILGGLWVLLANANDFYDLRVAANRKRSMQRLFSITGQMLIVYLIVFFFSPRDALPRLFILYYGVASFVFITLWRLINPALIGWASTARNMMIVGAGPAACDLIEAIHAQSEEAYVVRGIIGETERVGEMMAGVPVVGTGEDLMNYVRRDRISELVVTSMHGLSDDTFKAIMDAYESGVVIVPMPLLYESITGRVPVEYVNDHWTVVLPIDGTSIFDPYLALKRVFEVLLSLVGMAGFLLLLPFIALLIKLDSSGPIFYAQERVGYKGRVFRVHKFRSMVVDAEASTGAVFSRQGDPRVTRVGRFLRKTRLDELPQLINVLRGDMSLIGPRPERPEHVCRLSEKIPFYRTRLVIRPGLTGWAQVRYQYGSDDNDAMVKLQYDLYYIRHQSLWLDLNILVRTVGRVLRMSGV
jgi:exopolysaccharide biosynthesis polyprenyl glycosylphosphotransferase